MSARFARACGSSLPTATLVIVAMLVPVLAAESPAITAVSADKADRYDDIGGDDSLLFDAVRHASQALTASP